MVVSELSYTSTVPQQYTYDATNTPQVTSITPNVLSVLGKILLNFFFLIRFTNWDNCVWRRRNYNSCWNKFANKFTKRQLWHSTSYGCVLDKHSIGPQIARYGTRSVQLQFDWRLGKCKVSLQKRIAFNLLNFKYIFDLKSFWKYRIQTLHFFVLAECWIHFGRHQSHHSWRWLQQVNKLQVDYL